MDQLVGELIVILQRMHETERLQTLPQRGIQGQPQELGVAGGQGVVVIGPVDEVVGQVGPHSAVRLMSSMARFSS
jgi:uncharacterized membrane protein